jgi:hypothetical protein
MVWGCGEAVVTRVFAPDREIARERLRGWHLHRRGDKHLYACKRHAEDPRMAGIRWQDLLPL